MADTGYIFKGIGHAEAKDRITDLRSGVPGLGSGQVILAAPPRRSSSVAVMNNGEADIVARLKHGSKTKTVTGEWLAAFLKSATHFVGRLAFKAIVPSTVAITGGALVIVDDGAGVLYDTGFIGVASHKRGTIDYLSGNLDVTFAAGPTTPNIAYSHNDYTDFSSPTQTTTKAAAAAPFTMQLSFGRVVPFSLAITDGALTFVDDGKGNVIETTGGTATVAGTIDYALGLVVLTTLTAPLGGTVTATFKFNPFAAVLVKAGGAKLLDIYGMIPELTGAAWAAGIKAESAILGLGLWAEGRTAVPSAITVIWSHYGEEPFQVKELYSSVQAGGFDNDPAVFHDQAHL